MKIKSYIIIALMAALTKQVLATDSTSNASGSIGEHTFDVPVICEAPLGSKVLSSLFSFKSINYKDKDYDGIKIFGHSLEGGRLLFTIIIDGIERRILTNSYQVKDGVLNDSGVVTNNAAKTSYSYDITIKCK